MAQDPMRKGKPNRENDLHLSHTCDTVFFAKPRDKRVKPLENKGLLDGTEVGTAVGHCPTNFSLLVIDVRNLKSAGQCIFLPPATAAATDFDPHSETEISCCIMSAIF